MSRYERKRREKRAKVWGAIMAVGVGLAVGVGVGTMVGRADGIRHETERANSVISEYMAREYGSEMLERCEADGLKDCRIEFDYTDEIITGIEVVGHK